MKKLRSNFCYIINICFVFLLSKKSSSRPVRNECFAQKNAIGGRKNLRKEEKSPHLQMFGESTRLDSPGSPAQLTVQSPQTPAILIPRSTRSRRIRQFQHRHFVLALSRRVLVLERDVVWCLLKFICDFIIFGGVCAFCVRERERGRQTETERDRKTDIPGRKESNDTKE